MIRRYLYTLLCLLALLGLYWLTLLPLLAVRTNLESRHFALALLVWGVIAGVLFIPALAVIIKKVWFFKGKGEPVVLDMLLSMLNHVNELDAPVMVRKHNRKIVCTWRHREPHWCERLEASGMKRFYELWIRFDNTTKTATLSDRYRAVNWDLSPISVKTGRFSFSRPLFKVELGDAWGIENYEDTEPQEYDFTPGEIKLPVMNTILQNGWNVRFSLF